MKLHSSVDIITNSSSIIYTWVSKDAIEKAYKALQDMISILGLNYDAKDFFEVKITLDDEFLEEEKLEWEDEWTGLKEEYASFEDYIQSRLGQDNNEYGDHKYVRIFRKSDNQEVTFTYLLDQLYEREAVFS